MERPTTNKNVFIINGHQYWEMSPGRLNRTLAEFAGRRLEDKGHSVRVTHIDAGYDIDDEIESMLWSSVVIFQFPVLYQNSIDHLTPPLGNNS